MISFGGVGKLGEDLAVRFLKDKGWDILKRNYRKNYGEIDIIARKGEKLGFFEIKAVSCEIIGNVGKETFLEDRPEERVDSAKLRKIRKIIETYFFEKKLNFEDIEWEFGILSVFVDEAGKRAYVKFLEDFPLE
ncbi:MAG: YraN family protein [Patescibacteria group bacterium]